MGSEGFLEATWTCSSSCDKLASEVCVAGEGVEMVTEVEEEEVAAATDAKVLELVVQELGRETTFV